MRNVMKHKDVLLDEFYLDDAGQVRRSKDAYGRARARVAHKAGDLAKFYIQHGYEVFRIPRSRVNAFRHHLVMLLCGFDIPKGVEVDHVDGNPLNNHPSNLRLVTPSVNSKNTKMRSCNKSGVTGISWDKNRMRYVVQRSVNGKAVFKRVKGFEEAMEILGNLTNEDGKYTKRHGMPHVQHQPDPCNDNNATLSLAAGGEL